MAKSFGLNGVGFGRIETTRKSEQQDKRGGHKLSQQNLNRF